LIGRPFSTGPDTEWTVQNTSGSFVTNIAIVYAWEMAKSMPSDPLVNVRQGHRARESRYI
jgi:hypothetical protein